MIDCVASPSRRPAIPQMCNLAQLPVKLWWDDWCLAYPKRRWIETDCDLLEALSDGGSIWREMVPGLEDAVPKLLEWSKRTYSDPQLLFVSSSVNAAALILATCGADTVPEVVMQSRPGIDMQVGNNRLMGVVRRDFGRSPLDFGIFSIGPRNDRTRNL